MRAPALSTDLLITDDALRASAVSCALARPGTYFPVLDGPRMKRLDSDAEATRRTNAVARAGSRTVFLTGLPDDGHTAIRRRLPERYIRTLTDDQAIQALLPPDRRAREPLAWGRDRIGVGLLLAMQQGTSIRFEDRPSPDTVAPPKSGHLVICEAGEDLTEVIAANYAYALKAGLHIIPAIDDTTATRLMDRLYRIFDQDVGASVVAEEVSRELRGLCGSVDVPRGGSLTFFTRKLPFGLGFPEVPSTHLFTYPDAGLPVINGFAAGLGGRTDDVAILVDPGTTTAPEIDAAARILSERGMFVRGYSSRGANVRDVSDAVDHFPYDLAIFATHCGDAHGLRRSYEFPDATGLTRRLTVDVAVSFSRPKADGRMRVTEFTRFHELDGVDWSDEHAKDALPVGSAITTFMKLRQADRPIEPVETSELSRVIGSAAMKMHDHNWMPQSPMIADRKTPVILNNACVSWHELGLRFVYAGARAYIGTLCEVTDAEASAVATCFFGKHFEKTLPHALWCAQNEIYDTGKRRPYVMTGVYTQRLHPGRGDTPRAVISKLREAKSVWDDRLTIAQQQKDTDGLDGITAIAAYYREELAAMIQRWDPPGDARVRRKTRP